MPWKVTRGVKICSSMDSESSVLSCETRLSGNLALGQFSARDWMDSYTSQFCCRIHLRQIEWKSVSSYHPLNYPVVIIGPFRERLRSMFLSDRLHWLAKFEQIYARLLWCRGPASVCPQRKKFLIFDLRRSFESHVIAHAEIVGYNTIFPFDLFMLSVLDAMDCGPYIWL